MSLNYELFHLSTNEIILEGTQESLLENFSSSFTGTNELDQYEINFILKKDLNITCYLDKYQYEPWLMNLRLIYKNENKSFNTFEQESTGIFVKDNEKIKVTYIKTASCFVIQKIFFDEDVVLRYRKRSEIQEVGLKILAQSTLDLSSIIFDVLLKKAIIDFNKGEWSKSISNLLICLEVNKENDICINYLTSAYYYNEEYKSSLKYLKEIYHRTKDEQYINDMISIYIKLNDTSNIKSWSNKVLSKSGLKQLEEILKTIEPLR